MGAAFAVDRIRILSFRQRHDIDGQALPMQNRHRADGRLAACAIRVERQRHTACRTFEKTRMELREGRALRGHRVVKPCAMAGDDIQLAFADQRLAGVLKRLPRKIIRIEQLALLEKVRLRAVDVFRRLRIRVQHTRGETDDAA